MSRIPATGSRGGESCWLLQGRAGQRALCHGVGRGEVGSRAFLKEAMAHDEREEKVCPW